MISPFGPEHLFNFRIGKLAPNLYDGFQEMWLMTDNGVDTLFTYNPIGFNGGTGLAEEDAGVSLPARARAIEMYGVAGHRLFYTVGRRAARSARADRTGPFGSNSQKDFYARVDYKFGGMGLDGDTTGVKLPPENWREKSLRVGVFGYSGNGKDVDFDVTDADGNRLQDAGPLVRAVGLFASLVLRRPERLRRRDARHRQAASSRRRHDAEIVARDDATATTPGSPRPTGSSRPPFQVSAALREPPRRGDPTVASTPSP